MLEVRERGSQEGVLFDVCGAFDLHRRSEAGRHPSQLSRTRFLFWRSGSDFISISSHQPGGRERGEVALRSLAISQVTACSDEAEGRFPASEERERE